VSCWCDESRLQMPSAVWSVSSHHQLSTTSTAALTDGKGPVFRLGIAGLRAPLERVAQFGREEVCGRCERREAPSVKGAFCCCAPSSSIVAQMSEELNTGRLNVFAPHLPRAASAPPCDGNDRPPPLAPPLGGHRRVSSPVQPRPSGSRAPDAGFRSAPSGASPAAVSPRLPPPRTSSLRPSIPGGGSHLPKGDQPGDPYATLIVIAADGLVSTAPPRWSPGGIDSRAPLAPPIERGVEAAVALTGAMPRCVVVCCGGDNATAAQMMTHMVACTPGGIDAYGPGRRVSCASL
jgi:hypothetical protein